MKGRHWIVLLAVIGAAILVPRTLNRRDSVPGAPVPIIPEPQTAPSVPPPPVLPAKVVVLPIAESAATLNSPELTAQDDISILDLLFSNYQKQFGGNPVGENEEIAAALLGRNPQRLAFLPAEGAFLDSDGRIIDRWGTPYFFHALSGRRMEIVSAGPDRLHHTPDDLRSEP